MTVFGVLVAIVIPAAVVARSRKILCERVLSPFPVHRPPGFFPTHLQSSFFLFRNRNERSSKQEEDGVGCAVGTNVGIGAGVIGPPPPPSGKGSWHSPRGRLLILVTGSLAIDIVSGRGGKAWMSLLCFSPLFQVRNRSQWLVPSLHPSKIIFHPIDVPSRQIIRVESIAHVGPGVIYVIDLVQSEDSIGGDLYPIDGWLPTEGYFSSGSVAIKSSVVTLGDTNSGP